MTRLTFMQTTQKNIPLTFFTQDQVAHTVEEAKVVREQKIPEPMRSTDSRQRIIRIATRDADNLPVFVISGEDGFKQLWDTMKPLLAQTKEGEAFLHRLKTMEKLNARMEEVLSYMRRSDEERDDRGEEYRNTPSFTPWLSAADGKFYNIDVWDKGLPYIKRYLNDVARGIDARHKEPVRIETVVESGNSIAALTGTNIPGTGHFPSRYIIQQLVVSLAIFLFLVPVIR